jgi:hypothetical protein
MLGTEGAGASVLLGEFLRLFDLGDVVPQAL